jgi:hypothetical protein
VDVGNRRSGLVGEFLLDFQNGVDAIGIEMPATLVTQMFQGILEIPRVLIRTHRQQRIRFVGAAPGQRLFTGAET